jgi:SAM-dependent methyltransferase
MASTAEVRAFLDSTTFSGYQSVPLPGGLTVPGKDRGDDAARILSDRVSGKSVLDIGTYYGYFPCEAIRRGARSAVGLEPDPARYEIARRIAELNGGHYEIRPGPLADVPSSERFDVVLFLNVLHHVSDPLDTMRQLVSHCKQTLIVQFRLPSDPAYLRDLKSTRLWRGVTSRTYSILLALLCRRLPLMAVGNREYHRGLYFSRDAFAFLFCIHEKLFQHIDFIAPADGSERVTAICRVRADA